MLTVASGCVQLLVSCNRNKSKGKLIYKDAIKFCSDNYAQLWMPQMGQNIQFINFGKLLDSRHCRYTYETYDTILYKRLIYDFCKVIIVFVVEKFGLEYEKSMRRILLVDMKAFRSNQWMHSILLSSGLFQLYWIKLLSELAKNWNGTTRQDNRSKNWKMLIPNGRAGASVQNQGRLVSTLKQHSKVGFSIIYDIIHNDIILWWPYFRTSSLDNKFRCTDWSICDCSCFISYMANP